MKEGDRVSDGQVIGVIDETDMATQIENARIQVENAQLSLKNAQDRLEDYSITSTITGTVIEKNVDVGDNVGGSSASGTSASYMAVIYDMSALTFDINVSDLDINKIQVGQKVEITADALDGESFTGVVDKVNINGATQGALPIIRSPVPGGRHGRRAPQAGMNDLRQDHRGACGQCCSTYSGGCGYPRQRGAGGRPRLPG